MEGHKTSSLSTMRINPITGREATWDLTACLEARDLSTGCMGCGCHCVPLLGHPVKWGTFLRQLPQYPEVPREHTSCNAQSIDAHFDARPLPPTQGWPPSPRHSPKNLLRVYNPATSASWTRHGGKRRHTVSHSCPESCYRSSGSDDKSCRWKTERLPRPQRPP